MVSATCLPCILLCKIFHNTQGKKKIFHKKEMSTQSCNVAISLWNNKKKHSMKNFNPINVLIIIYGLNILKIYAIASQYVAS